MHSAPSRRYTRTAVVLHWAMALLLGVIVALALAADHLPDEWIRPAIDAHKSFGVLAFGLVLLRLWWRAGHPPPPAPADRSRWQRLAATCAHMLLYLLMLALPLTGLLRDSARHDAAFYPHSFFGLFDWPPIASIVHMGEATKQVLHEQLSQWHAGLGYALYAVLALHVLAALKHRLVDRDRGFRRVGP